MFGSVPWQRCQFHLQQNAGAYLPRQSMKLEVAADIQSMFNAPDRKTAEELLQATLLKYVFSVPHLSEWLQDNLSEGYSVFNFSSGTPQNDPDNQQSEENQQRNPQSHQNGRCFSKRSIVSQIGLCIAHGDQ